MCIVYVIIINLYTYFIEYPVILIQVKATKKQSTKPCLVK